jgi:hypothetical protein
MPARPGVFAGVLIRRAVATQRLAAFLTCPQVHPPGPDLHALSALTASRTFDRGDSRKMGATSIRHTSHRFQLALGTPSRLDPARPLLRLLTLNNQHSTLTGTARWISQGQRAESHVRRTGDEPVFRR